jgi:hypothetical protein
MYALKLIQNILIELQKMGFTPYMVASIVFVWFSNSVLRSLDKRAQRAHQERQAALNREHQAREAAENRRLQRETTQALLQGVQHMAHHPPAQGQLIFPQQLRIADPAHVEARVEAVVRQASPRRASPRQATPRRRSPGHYGNTGGMFN